MRGTFLKGKYDDLPTMIFFTEACDLTNNWIPFFTNPHYDILSHRNVWLLNPRNFGNSDRHPSFDLSEMADDVMRFMYSQKISMATLGGHGIGAKIALATGCYHSERVTGVFAIDSTPMDQRYHEAFKEFKGYIGSLNEINFKTWSDKDVKSFLKENIKDPKWRSIFTNNISKNAKTGNDAFNFELSYLNHNLNFNKADSLGNWAVKHGMFTGRAHFVFPEYSRWVHLATNTLPMYKVCARVKGFGHDIFYLQGDENPLNHWIYDFENYATTTASKLNKFLNSYDGVHILLKDRTEIGNFLVPDRKNSRTHNPNHVYDDYSPAHLHHNWRFNNIYE